MKYSKTSVGKLINPEFITVSSEASASEALATVKEKLIDSPFSSYIYALNNQGLLVGVIKLADLLIQEGDTQVFKFMEQDVVVSHLTTPQEIALKRMLKYKLYALPIIEDTKKMIGVVTFDDMIEDVERKL